MSDSWFYEFHRNELGPVSSAELRTLIGAGRLPRSVRVRQEGSTRWSRFDECEAQIVQSDCTPDELNDLSELNFSFEDSGLGTQDRWAVGSTAAGNQRVLAPSHDEADFNSILIESSDSAAVPRSTPYGQPLNEDVADYYCQSVGEVLGPVTLQELREHIASGVLDADTPIRRGADGEWGLAASFSEVATALPLLQSDSSGGTAASRGPTPQQRSPLEQAARRSSHSGTVPGRSRKLSAQQELRRLRRENARLKKQQNPDPLLNEIFSEVFGNDESAGQAERRASTAPPSTAETSQRTARSAAPEIPAAASPDVTGACAPAPVATPTPNPVAVRKPPRRQAPRFQLPDLKLPGVVVAGVGLIAAVVWLAGNTDLGFRIEPEQVAQTLTEYKTRYTQLSAGTTADADWEAFRQDVRADAKSAIDSLRSESAPTTRTKNLLAASTRLVQLVNLKADDKQRQQEIYTDFVAALAVQ